MFPPRAARPNTNQRSFVRGVRSDRSQEKDSNTSLGPLGRTPRTGTIPSSASMVATRGGERVRIAGANRALINRTFRRGRRAAVRRGRRGLVNGRRFTSPGKLGPLPGLATPGAVVDSSVGLPGGQVFDQLAPIYRALLNGRGVPRRSRRDRTRR